MKLLKTCPKNKIVKRVVFYDENLKNKKLN